MRNRPGLFVREHDFGRADLIARLRLYKAETNTACGVDVRRAGGFDVSVAVWLQGKHVIGDSRRKPAVAVLEPQGSVTLDGIKAKDQGKRLEAPACRR